WLYMTIRCSPEVAEAVHERLLPLSGNRGTVERSAGKDVVVVGIYVPEDDEAPAVLEKLTELVRELREFFPAATVTGPRAERIPAQDWEQLWRRHHKVLTIGRVVIKPTWLRAPEIPEGGVVVELEPQMAFGTGSHSSTQLALLALQDHLHKGDVIADVGTGTGILAIAAALLGAARVYATDADPLAVRAARANARLNGVAEVVAASAGEYLAGVPAPLDGVVANISPTADEELVPLAAAHLRPGGFLVLSGFTNRAEERLRRALEDAGFAVTQRYAEAEWVCLGARKPGGDANSGNA
ncbi:MAG: 50S ribosomal protein L11 methyltransferase, partial [Armatimonadetes bacterium]|nr:50S ribosomal protein L11 methyltransferase [Armatimonadota bacterium]